MYLWEVPVGKIATIQKLDSKIDSVWIQRLKDLGFSNGYQCECIRRSPFSGPKLFKTAYGVYALEKSIAEKIEVHL